MSSLDDLAAGVARIKAMERQDRGACTCEYGCRSCGMPEARMGNCPAWSPCPLGRAHSSDCPEHSS